MLGTKRWEIPTPEAELDETFSREVPVSRVLSTVLWNRGIRTAEQARKFINPTMADLHDPGLFDGMDLAVARARRAIEQGEKIMVHGDYDADGITSTALLVRVLSAIGADVTWYVPHRQRDGYDIRPPAIEAAREQGVGLVITADCGTSAVEAADLARSCGIDLIVTDHHEPAAELADAFALINPLKPGCAYPFKDLAGVGVAFKFAEALVRDCGYDVEAYRRKFIDLVAVGTVADVVPLLGENRILVKFGMEEIARTGKLGLRALVDRSGLGAKGITSRNI
ncbi:MAG: DHH family phosphoesterase, partial [Armatimonadetes bacterium]|nr:DHH family phosphoesterase [Armatimonadota bacterium]